MLAAKSKCSRAGVRWKVAGGNGGTLKDVTSLTTPSRPWHQCLQCLSPLAQGSVSGLNPPSLVIKPLEFGLFAVYLGWIHGALCCLRCSVCQHCME